jgi:glutamate racemase
LRNNARIGVIDSGLGGLTVVSELERILPGEGIYYFGDSANCPYASRPRHEIFRLASAMLDFLRDKNVKIVAVACNTISAIADDLRERYDFSIVSIIEAASAGIAALNPAHVGIFATEFTIRQKVYEKLLAELIPLTRVYGISSRKLAAMVDEARFDGPEVIAEAEVMLRELLGAHPEVKQIVLACTHYPIVRELFEKAAPGLTFLNPAADQANEVKKQLEGRGLLSAIPGAGLDIFTSGDKAPYEAALKKLKIRRPAKIHSAG